MGFTAWVGIVDNIFYLHRLQSYKMTPTKLKEKLQHVKQIYIDAVKNIQREYALNNNQYKIGDIISDRHGTIIKIDKMNWDKGGIDYKGREILPFIVYSGVALYKTHKPKTRRSIINQYDIVSTTATVVTTLNHGSH